MDDMTASSTPARAQTGPAGALADPRAYRGVILGTAMGDALGLPYEGLPPRRVPRLLPFPLRPRFLAGRAMVSDDTEHTIMVAQSLLACPADERAFARDLAWRLRGWLLAAPAGVGLATLRAGIKLMVGFSPEHSGVWSAGNGPAMRAAVLGVCLGSDSARLRAYVRASTRLTHTDPRAEHGALAVALAAHHAATRGSGDCLGFVRDAMRDVDSPEWREAMDQAEGLARGCIDLPADGKGVSGYVYRTVPAAVGAWLRHPRDFREVVGQCVRWGGDTDTVGAIAGALAGTALGEEEIPAEWLASLWEWPRGLAWMRDLADRLQETFSRGARPGPLPMRWPLVPVRNGLFACVVLAHGFRRLLPPW